MSLKNASLLVIIALSISLLYSLVTMVLPNELLGSLYKFKIGYLPHLFQTASLLLFFIVLFRNQK